MNLKGETLNSEKYERLMDIFKELASTLDLDPLLRKIAHAATDLSMASVASILLYDEPKRQLYFQTVTNQEDEAKMRGIIVPEESIAGWVASHRQPTIISDVHDDTRFFNDVEQKIRFPTQSMIAVPMIAQEKLIGVLEVLNKKVANFTLEDQETIQFLGTMAAVAIENARLFQQFDLISELAHEIRTPLSSITTIAYILDKAEIPFSQRSELAHTIISEIQRLNELATNFLDLARMESGRISFKFFQFDLFELGAECQQLMEPKAKDAGVTITLIANNDHLIIEADRDKIKQVLINLLSNAIKYNHPGGKIVISIALIKEKISIEINDTGKGIPATDIPHLFERFYRGETDGTTVTGTGLGLSICKKIISSHAGEIFVDSTPGLGSTFRVVLPVAQQSED